MLSEFRKFVGFMVLEFFLKNPSREIHIRKLSRELGISVGSAKTYCYLLRKENILKEKKQANLKLFRLDNENYISREYKKAYYLTYLKELGIEEIVKNEDSLAIYGSYASGNFDEKSDIDILVIGENKDINNKKLISIKNKSNKEIQLTVIPYYKWETMKKKNDSFSNSVLKNYILIKGVEL